MNQDFVIPRRRRRVRPYLDLTAMIDVVFNLLIFFAVASTVVGARTALPLRLPSAETVQPVPDRVVVTLLPDQPALIDGKSVAAGGIGAALKEAAGIEADTQVVIVADEEVPYAQLVGVLDEVRLADYHRIALAASPKQGDGGARESRP